MSPAGRPAGDTVVTRSARLGQQLLGGWHVWQRLDNGRRRVIHRMHQGGAAAQSDSAVTSIRIAAGAVPALVIIPAIALMVTYPLTEKKFRQIAADIAQRHAELGPNESRAHRV